MKYDVNPEQLEVGGIPSVEGSLQHSPWGTTAVLSLHWRRRVSCVWLPHRAVMSLLCRYVASP